MSTKKEIRELNGYRLLLIPDHPRAMKNKNWEGYVYEHIVVVEKFTKQHIRINEDVHHLDGNKSNNRIENLLVVERGQHTKLHNWLKSGSPGHKRFCTGADTINASDDKVWSCSCCGQTLQRGQNKFCSHECSAIGKRKIKNRPNKSQLVKDIGELSWIDIGRKYGVSDNAVRKWAKQVGIHI